MLAIAEIPEVLKRIVGKTVAGYQPDKIILFGSHAYGTPDNESDIDLLIIKEDSRQSLQRRIEVRRLLREENARVGFTLLVHTQEEIDRRLRMGDDFFLEILEQGRILYERES